MPDHQPPPLCELLGSPHPVDFAQRSDKSCAEKMLSDLCKRIKRNKTKITSRRAVAAHSQLGFGFPDTPNPQDIFKLWNSDKEFGFILTVVIHSLSWSLMP